VTKHVIYKKRSMDADIASSKLRYLVPPKFTFEVEVDWDSKVYDLVKKDAVMLQEMNDEVGKIYEQNAEAIKSKLEAFEALITKMVDNNADKADIERQKKGLDDSIQKDHDTAEKAAEKAVEKVWSEWSRKKSEYKSYKAKIVITIVGSVASLAASIGMMVSTPFTGGAGAVVGILSMVKSVVQIARELASAAQDVETSLKVLDKQLEILEKVAKTNIGRKANEYAGALGTQILGIAQPTIKSAKSNLETVQAKLTPVETDVREAGKLLNDLLDEQEKMRAAFMKDVDARLSKHPSDKAPGQARDIERRLDQYLRESRQGVMAQIALLTKIGENFRTVRDAIDERARKVKDLSDQRDVDERFLRLLLTFADLGVGVGLACTEGGKAAGEIVNAVVPWSTFFAYDELSKKVLEKTFLAD
jgi:hypothetical protein